MKQKKGARAGTVPVMFVCVPSPLADQTTQALESVGLAVTRADNVCFAEMYADTQHFAAAVYDHSLSQEEQVSLAQVMRIRWPWMRILRWVSAQDPLLGDELFDWSVYTQAELAVCAASRLTPQA